MTGTNDIGLDRLFGTTPGRFTEESIRALLAEVRWLGSVPVLSTLPPAPSAMNRKNVVDPYNLRIARLAKETKTPLINLWRALARPSMHNQGMDPGGLHLGTHTDRNSAILTPEKNTYRESVDFRPEALRFGANRRNLVWLQTLARLDVRARNIKAR